MWKRVRGRHRLFLALLVLLLAAAGSGAWLLTRDGSAAAASSTATVTTQTIEQTVSADGTIAARRTSDESFAVSGTVTRVAVEAGDEVTEGDVLAVVDPAALEAARRAAASSLTAAISQLDDDEDAAASDVQLASDSAAILAARASLTSAREAVADATLRATISGTVTTVGIAVGDAAGTQSSSAASSAASSTTGSTSGSTGTISIVSTGSYVVDATVAAEDATQLKKGLQADITVTGVDETVYGTVTAVGLVAQTNDSGAAVFPVTIVVTGKQKDLYAGVSATASIVVKQVPDVLTVSSRALTTEDGTTYVTKIVDGAEVKTEVETGETYGMTTEVVSGLADGDEVVVPGFTMPTGSGDTTQQEGFPGDGQMPDFSQMGGQPPAGGAQ